ncbi:MAG: hypothetical protein J7J51_03245 [Candidatus Omnitrophica bacterium]|nr:hypothetical protein [Candidatus Omnitrophota bacterium]
MSGIIGVFSTKKKDVTDSLTYGLFAQQNRGENGAGVATIKHGIKIKKGHKSVGDLFSEKTDAGRKSFYEFLRETKPYAGIGHTLYEKSSGLQPTEIENDRYHIALVMDGVFLGYKEKNDIVLARIFFKALNETEDEIEATARVMEILDDAGFYNACILVQNKNETKLVAFRDPRGGKPLSLGKNNNTYAIASETQGLDGAQIPFLKDIEPGSICVIDEEGLRTEKLVEKKHFLDIFEYIYFASPNSIIQGKNVLEVRKKLGRRLFERYGYKPDILCPSPDSGRGCALGYSEASGVEIKEYITKNPGAPRTFQVEDPTLRRLASLSKFNINPLVKGKRVGICEDSIVRGTVMGVGTSAKLKARGAKEVGVLVSYAPISFHSYRSDVREKMVAEGLAGRPVEEIGEIVAKSIGVDYVFYNDISDVIEICGGGNFCTDSATGDYSFIKKKLLRFK